MDVGINKVTQSFVTCPVILTSLSYTDDWFMALGIKCHEELQTFSKGFENICQGIESKCIFLNCFAFVMENVKNSEYEIVLTRKFLERTSYCHRSHRTGILSTTPPS